MTRKRTASRIEKAVKAVIYLILAAVAFRVVTSTSTGGQGGEQVTAKLLQMTGGQVLVGLAGVVIVAAAVVLAWRGLQTKFEEHLDLSELGPGARSAVITLGKVGYVARGIVFALVGIMVVVVAVTLDPDKARGMDAALRQVAAQPYGPWLLSLMALGLMCFGAYSLADPATDGCSAPPCLPRLWQRGQHACNPAWGPGSRGGMVTGEVGGPGSRQPGTTTRDHRDQASNPRNANPNTTSRVTGEDGRPGIRDRTVVAAPCEVTEQPSGHGGA